MTRRWALPVVAAVLLAWVALAVLLGAAAQIDGACTACHTMWPYAKATAKSAHANVDCLKCHGQQGALGAFAEGFAMQRRAVGMVLGHKPDTMELDDKPCLTCHKGVKKGVLIARGIAVRHEDYIGASCLECHGGTGHTLVQRTYTTPEMESCLNCHKTAATELDNCAVCHPEDQEADRRITDTSWRKTHGTNWQKMHGMGELDTCENCHVRGFCGKCHGVAVPHPGDWSYSHGNTVQSVKTAQCRTCHKVKWCTDCHGIDMPHPAGFLPKHGPIAKAQDGREEPCYKCHNADACRSCHLASSHPNVPGVGFGHSRGGATEATFGPSPALPAPAQPTPAQPFAPGTGGVN